MGYGEISSKMSVGLYSMRGKERITLTTNVVDKYNRKCQDSKRLLKKYHLEFHAARARTS